MILYPEIENYPKIFEEVSKTTKEVILIGTPLSPAVENLYEKIIEFCCEMFFFEDKASLVLVGGEHYKTILQSKKIKFLKEEYGVTEDLIGIEIINSATFLSTGETETQYDYYFFTKEFEKKVYDQLSIPDNSKMVFICLDQANSMWYRIDEQKSLKMVLSRPDDQLPEFGELEDVDSIRAKMGLFDSYINFN